MRVERVPDLDTHINDTTIGVLKPLRCLSPATLIEKSKVAASETYLTQPDSQGLHFRYPRYGEDPDTGWSPGTQILGA